MMRPLMAKAASRGLSISLLGVAPRAGRRRLSIASPIQMSSIDVAVVPSTHRGRRDVVRMRQAAIVAGTAIALWATTVDKKSNVAACLSQTAESHSRETASTAAEAMTSAGSRSPKTVGKDEERVSKAAMTVPATDPAVALVVASAYNANGPMEDRHDIRQSPRGDFFASVYDGHGGWQAAELARKRLNIVAQTELKNSLAVDPDQVKGALTQAFLRVEREYLYQVKTAFELGFGAVARTGACAIMALVRDDKLYVANAGDCRAVLGRRRRRAWGGGGAGTEGVSEAIALSNDHNARELTEQAKLRKLHPHEGDVFTCKRSSACYVKGRLQPTRSLGDAYLKYPEFNGQEDTHRSAGRFMPPPYTPPYITAEPEIFVHKVDHNLDDFVVLASDGLWDHVTNEEAVEIVRAAAYEDGDPKSAGDRLIKRVLERAAWKHGISVQQLQEVPEGSTRRNIHDDITCVVFFLKGNRNNEGFGSLEGGNVRGVADKRGGEAPAQ